MVVRQRVDARPQLDSPCPFGSGGDEHLGRADYLAASGVVLANPRLIETGKSIKMHHQVQVVLELLRGVQTHAVIRRQPNTKSE